jgi:NADH:ubiquinone oxidoreductase subunit H
MKALTLLFAVFVLALSACQASSPFELPEGERGLQTADGCDPDASPC